MKASAIDQQQTALLKYSSDFIHVLFDPNVDELVLKQTFLDDIQNTKNDPYFYHVDPKKKSLLQN